MREDELRDLLRWRIGDGGPANPGRSQQVRDRVRRIRWRRLAGAAVTTVAVAAALTTAGMSLLTGGASPEEAVATRPTPLPGLPERFTTEDGADYRLLQSAKLATSTDRNAQVSVRIPLSGRPIDLATVCRGTPLDHFSGILVQVGKKVTQWIDLGRHAADCDGNRALTPLDVAGGKGNVKITFKVEVPPNRGICDEETNQCTTPPPKKTDWSLGVYEWTPPAEPASPPEVRKFPKQANPRGEGIWRRVAARSGVFPRDDSVTLEVPNNGRPLGFEHGCAGVLAERLSFEKIRNGTSLGSGGGCKRREKGTEFTWTMDDETLPKKYDPVSVTWNWSMPGGDPEVFANSPVGWSVAIYELVRTLPGGDDGE